MKIKIYLTFFFLSLSVLVYSQNLLGDVPITFIAESYDIRKNILDNLLRETKANVLAYRKQEVTNAWGQWQISTDVSVEDKAFYIIVSPKRSNQYFLFTQGTWIVKRAENDGSFVQAKIFLQSNAETFARIYPFGTRTRIDIIVYGGVLYRDVIIPLPFETILVTPFSEIKKLTSQVIDWELFSPKPELYADAQILIEKIRKNISGLSFCDDGAIDSNAMPVYIETLKPQTQPYGLNCSGFAKWIVDGLLSPVTNSYLSISSLKERMLDIRGSSFTQKFEESFDPFFGLDWSRALAKSVWKALYNTDTLNTYDVNYAPFALCIGSKAPLNLTFKYENFSSNFDDAGIEMRGLKAMLFILANKEPGYFYLAAFNSRGKTKPYLRTYFHIAVLFPYFDKHNVFRVAVFESAAETSIDSLMSRAAPNGKYEFVKLMRLPVLTKFEPPKF